MDSFISARGRSKAITVLVILQVVLLAAELGGWLVYSASLDTGDLDGPARFINAVTPLQGLAFLATFVLYLTWIYRATANLPALGAMNRRFAPGWAVGYYFIPFLNLVRGYQVMAEVWRESQPAAVDANGTPLPRKATIVGWWWGLYIAMNALTKVTSIPHSMTAEALRSQAQGSMFLAAFTILEAIVFLVMVRGAQKRQDEQWQDLERRRNVPQPTAEALR